MQNSSLPIVYRYFGRSGNNDRCHSGIICVASQLDKDNNILSLGASFCSPKDIFIKNKARTIAKGRLLKDSSRFVFHLNHIEVSHEFLNQLIIRLINQLYKYPEANWAKKLINQLIG